MPSEEHRRTFQEGVIERRADFSAATRRLIAERAGYQCSVLNCGVLTIGPGPGPRSVVQQGMAAHIYAARSRGPRGTGGLSYEQLREPENGLWCCYTHGKAIDSENGGGFSAADLLAWKRLHEARKGAELLGVATDRFGLVESISVHAPPGPLNGRQFELSMRNLIVGPIGSGKTMLAMLIASVSYPEHVAVLSRMWDIDVAVRWFDPLAHHVTTRGRSGRLHISLDGESVPYVARPFKTIYIPHRNISGPVPRLGRLAQLLDLSVQAVRSTIELMPQKSEVVREVSVGQHTFEATIELGGRLHRVAPGQSGGLWSIFLAELAAVHAGYHANVEPTFMIVDEYMYGVHPNLEIACLERLERIAGNAQIAVITHSPQLVDHFRASWQVTSLDYSAPIIGRAPSIISAEFSTTAATLQV